MTLLLAALVATLQPTPARSIEALVSSNGASTLAYSLAQKRFDRFLQHPYKFESEGVATRDLLSDAYFGVGVGADHKWLTDVDVDAVGYENGTAIMAVSQHYGGLRLTTYGFAPRNLQGAAFVLVLRVDNDGVDVADVSVASLLHARLGAERPEPSATNEYIQYTEQGYEQFGAFQMSGAAMVARALEREATHTAGAPFTSDNPYGRFLAGQTFAGANAGFNGDDLAQGFQWQLGSIAAGTHRTVALLVSFDAGNIASDAWGRLNDWLAETTDADALLATERAAWSDTQVDLPAEMADGEQALYRQSLAVLKMSQVQESGRANGQILASPAASTANEYNQWNITWVRDMAYATKALIEAGQFSDARAALTFQLQAQSGKYKDQVGKPYQISVCRYLGEGDEESDSNADGPNIELDGFGLFLWTLNHYHLTANDSDFATTYWPVVRDAVANVLVAAIEPYTGLIKADSSIWETHWNGKQQQFAYTSITAVAGLCAAGDLADALGDKDKARTYRNAGRQVRQGLLDHLIDAQNVIAASVQQLNSGHDYYDAAVIEAVTLGVIDPQGDIAKATLSTLREKLSSGEARGIFRNDDGGDYDKQEWIMLDLRLSQAFGMAGLGGDDVWQWVNAQSNANANVIAELYAADTAQYAGSVPMAGFGAGAYVLAANARYGLTVPTIACGSYDNTPEGANDHVVPTSIKIAPSRTGCGASGAGAGSLLAGAWCVLRFVRRRCRE